MKMSMATCFASYDLPSLHHPPSLNPPQPNPQPQNTTQQSAISSRIVQQKDYSRPLHVDCSVEYELPSQAKPPPGGRNEPLLMIHPCYFRKMESQRRSPFINNLPGRTSTSTNSTRKSNTSTTQQALTRTQTNSTNSQCIQRNVQQNNLIQQQFRQQNCTNQQQTQQIQSTNIRQNQQIPRQQSNQQSNSLVQQQHRNIMQQQQQAVAAARNNQQNSQQYPTNNSVYQQQIPATNRQQIPQNQQQTPHQWTTDQQLNQQHFHYNTKQMGAVGGGTNKLDQQINCGGINNIPTGNTLGVYNTNNNSTINDGGLWSTTNQSPLVGERFPGTADQQQVTLVNSSHNQILDNNKNNNVITGKYRQYLRTHRLHPYMSMAASAFPQLAQMQQISCYNV